MLECHDFAPDFVLPTMAGVATRFYGIAGGRITLLVFLPSDDGDNLFSELVALSSELDVAVFFVHGQEPSVTQDRVFDYVDTSGTLRKHYGAETDACVFLLSENLRVIEVFRNAQPIQCSAAIRQSLDSMPGVDAQLILNHAPVLLIPHVLDDDFCDRLIGVLETNGGEETGVEVSRAGRRQIELHQRMKRRRDHTVADTQLLGEITRRVARRVKPEVRKAFSFEATQFEGFKIGCYDSEPSGFFKPHRDNLSPATAHRRFALSVNLNDDYTGGQLRFPEYGPVGYHPAKGGAIVFSGSLLHEAREVTRGRRFVLLSFMYGSEDRRRTALTSKSRRRARQ